VIVVIVVLAWLGKRDGVFILDGGLKAWHGAGLPLSLDAPSSVPGSFVGQPDNRLLLSAEGKALMKKADTAGKALTIP